MNKPEQPEQGKLQDPICGMEVSPDSPLRAIYQEREYFFCSKHCLAEFNQNPEKYACEPTSTEQGASPGQVYSCPMHPEVRLPEPGPCPECGMAL